MRLVKEAFPEMDSLPQEVRDVTSRLSADYLIHDLQTGHFVTVLRFISPLMVRLGVPERRFYQLLAAVLSDYMNKHPQMSERFALFSLFRPQIIRVVLNPVKRPGRTRMAAVACCRITLRICKIRCGW